MLGIELRPLEVDRQWRDMGRILCIPARVAAHLGQTVAALEHHHMPTARHSQRVGMLATNIAQLLELARVKPLFYGGSLHDCGKLDVDSGLLSKTGTWTRDDTEALSGHPMDGYHRVMAMGLHITAGIVVRHHRFQPHPYPVTEDIPSWGNILPGNVTEEVDSWARLVALGDFYDAAHRPNSDGAPNGQKVRERVFGLNPSEDHKLIARLYDVGIFSVDDADVGLRL